MRSFFVRRGATSVAILGVMALLAACEDKRIKEVDTGISRDSAVALLTQKKGTNDNDTTPLPNVYLREKYLIAGKIHEVLFYSSKDLKPSKKDSVDWRKSLTPVVIIGDKVIGKGWPVWDSISTANHIPLKPKGK